MKSESVRVVFSGNWDSVRSILSSPRRFFLTLPYNTQIVEDGGGIEVNLSLGKLLGRFKFTGRLTVAFREPHATYVLKGQSGLLIMAFTVLNGELVSKVSADVPGERFLGKKLKNLALETGTALARLAESHKMVSENVKSEGNMIVVKNINAALLPHIARHVRFQTLARTFSLEGIGEGKFLAVVEDDVFQRVEVEGRDGTSIIEVGKHLLDVTEADMEGFGLRGTFSIKVRS